MNSRAPRLSIIKTSHSNGKETRKVIGVGYSSELTDAQRDELSQNGKVIMKKKNFDSNNWIEISWQKLPNPEFE